MEDCAYLQIALEKISFLLVILEGNIHFDLLYGFNCETGNHCNFSEMQSSYTDVMKGQSAGSESEVAMVRVNLSSLSLFDITKHFASNLCLTLQSLKNLCAYRRNLSSCIWQK